MPLAARFRDAAFVAEPFTKQRFMRALAPLAGRIGGPRDE